MMARITSNLKAAALALTGAALMAAGHASAQELEAIDPDDAYSAQAPIDGDLEPAAPTAVEAQVQADGESAGELLAFGSAATATHSEAPPETGESEARAAATVAAEGQAEVELPVDTSTGEAEPAFAGSETTYGEDDLIGAAEGVFGKGAEGLAGLIEKLLREQGEPNAYIVGREGGGAIGIGLRYGSGTLYHKVEGNRPVYWTGPSIGFDAGANAAKTFVLVYNLYDTEELYERYPAGEGQAYLVGGMHASYMRKGDVVLIPIRVGAGLRLGVNAGYMKFSKKQRWLPF